jgi:hypothetical protein
VHGASGTPPLQDRADHLDDDTETESVVADVRVWHNGRDSYETRLESKVRRP